jgi:hypothetical protein
LLELHRVQPILEPKEKKALENFTGSDSWAKKFAKRHQLKMTGARIKELSEEEFNEFHSFLNTMIERIKQAGPGFEDVANTLGQAREKLFRVRVTKLSCPTSSNSARVASSNDLLQLLSVEEAGKGQTPTSTKATTISTNVCSPAQPTTHFKPAPTQKEQQTQ